MEPILHIDINGQRVQSVKTPPKSLQGGLWSSADIWGVTDARADILIQRIVTIKSEIWHYSFLVREAVKLEFSQELERMFILYNLGVRLRLQMADQRPSIYDHQTYNLIYLQKFRIKAFPKPHTKRYELLIMDTGGAARTSPTRVINKSIEGINRSNQHQ